MEYQWKVGKRVRFRIGDLEFRTCNIHLCLDGDHCTGEIVKWMDSTRCYVVASWRPGKEGFDLRFVGARPFEDVDWNDFRELAVFGQSHLTKAYEESRYDNE